jgi:hypothetical protein
MPRRAHELREAHAPRNLQPDLILGEDGVHLVFHVRSEVMRPCRIGAITGRGRKPAHHFCCGVLVGHEPTCGPSARASQLSHASSHSLRMNSGVASSAWSGE